MKAIITKYLGWTETKPSRIKVSAEGVPHRVYSNSALEKIQSDDSGERRNLHQIAAGLFAEERGWKNKLVSGGTPNPNIWCHCLVPKGSQSAPVAVSVNEELVGAVNGLLSAYAPFTNAASAALRGEDSLHPAVSGARKALERAKPFLHGQESVVAQARILLAQGVTQHADGKATLSGYHVALLAQALDLLDGPPPAPEKPAPWKVIAVSSNHGAFGHKGVIVARPSGEALELTLQAYGSTPLPVEGEWLDTLPPSEVQPRKLSALPQAIIDREFKPATAADFIAICGRNHVEVSVARENGEVCEAVDGGEASVSDIERIFRREF